MRTIEELKQFYEEELYPHLLELERARKKVRLKILSFHTIMIIITGVILYNELLSPKALASHSSVGKGFAFNICFLVWIIGSIFISLKNSNTLKVEIIGLLAKFIDSNLSFHAERMISENIFNCSHMFFNKTDMVLTEACFSGVINDVQFDFAQIRSSCGSGRHSKTIFKGLFFMADFNKYFNGKTLVIPDFAQKHFGAFGQKLQEMNKFQGDLIKLEDPEFEKQFVVYGSDQAEARYILTPSLMQRLLEYRSKVKKDIRISFADSKLFFAIPFGQGLFEPGLMRTVLDFGLIEEYFEHIQLAIGIAEDLNLNTNVWQNI